MSNLKAALDQYLVSINGVQKNPHEATISVFDRSFIFGDSVYEATLVKNKTPLFWQEHLARLKNSAHMIGLDLNHVNFSQLENWVENLLNGFTAEMGLLRIIITRGLGPVNIAPQETYENNVVIYLLPLHYPTEWYDKGLKYFISTYQRNSIKALDPRAKTGNYLNSQLALVEAKKNGFHDALLVNPQGFITEGTTNNFWFIKDNCLFTASSDQGILEGITRDKIFEICKQHSIKVQTGSYTIEQVLKADEAFMTSATKGVVPVVELSQWKIDQGIPGTLTQQLRSLYEETVTNYTDTKKWKSF